MADFEGKVALVTGAGSGIGRATAELFAARGAKVVVSDVSAKAGEETVAQIKAKGGEASFVACDVSDEAQVKAMVAHAVSTYGRLDHAVNNAGIDPELVPEAEWRLDHFDKIMGVNVRGVFLCMKEEIAQMLKQGGGTIVNIGSFASYAGVVNKPAYSASKHAVLGMTKASALQYGKQGIRINAICPGGVKTAIMNDNIGNNFAEGEKMVAANHPVGRVSEPSEIGEAVLFASGPGAAFMIGHGLLVDGGLAAQ
ncbi:glucose 1-dehydrogenase [Flavisphingomonas formosensis]|uniref:glucose 1-dehydrogenase n=1 Tax=Flavisphingomonas formosensis TaxID=861534 RepID=UPI0012FCFA1A|nr:glucose 1-dehydrogenase [Sphingomonas formosensis]